MTHFIETVDGRLINVDYVVQIFLSADKKYSDLYDEEGSRIGRCYPIKEESLLGETISADGRITLIQYWGDGADVWFEEVPIIAFRIRPCGVTPITIDGEKDEGYAYKLPNGSISVPMEGDWPSLEHFKASLIEERQKQAQMEKPR